jgi:hypothetical protein
MDIKDIYIFGVGAAGSNIFLNLLYAHSDLSYTVVDFDKVENRNITPGTQPYSKADINRAKTQALQKIAQISKQKKINAVNEKITTKKDFTNVIKDPKSSLIVDCFDNAHSRNLLIDKKYNVLHVGFSASLSGEAVWDSVFEPMETAKSDNDIDVCEMAIARPFIAALTGMASIVISNFIINGIKTNFYFDKNFVIRKF